MTTKTAASNGVKGAAELNGVTGDLKRAKRMARMRLSAW